MATINGVEVIGDKTAHDFDLLDKNDGINLSNGIERNREATEDNHADIVRHRTDTDVHVTPEWKNSLVSKETLGLYWTAAQTADIINEISIAGGAKLVKVDALPETGLEQTIYLVPKQDPQQGDIFNEYVWIDGKFEFIGTTKADLSGYFPITGGALTGNIIERNTDNDHLGISGSYWGHGAYLWLSGQNSGYAGSWYLSARDTEKSCDLVGSPSGVLSWGGKLVLTEDDLSNYATKTELNAKQDALSNQQIQNIADVANKANDADVVHKSENETISGLKTFGMLDPEGGQIDLEKSKSSLLTSNISIDSLGESLRFFAKDSGGIYTTFFINFQDGVIYSDRDCTLGTTSRKFADVSTKAINGLNPGALSLPNVSTGVVTVDTTNFTWNVEWSYTPVCDGWLSIQVPASSAAKRRYATRQEAVTYWYPNLNGEIFRFTIPVIKGIPVFFAFISDIQETTVPIIRLLNSQGNV